MEVLQFSPWKIEQFEFAAAEEAELEKQLAFSNGYISQYAFFEELYTGEQSKGTFLRGIMSPLPSVVTLSIRLGEDRLDLNLWGVQEFYRCLHKQEPCLERKLIATSKNGHTLKITARRMLSLATPQLLTIRYTIQSLNYSGPITVISLLGDVKGSPYWYPLVMQVDDQMAFAMCQGRNENVQIGIATTTDVTKNDNPIETPRIRIEKSHVLGYSVMDTISPNDVYVVDKKVAFADSLNFPDASLAQQASDILRAE